MMSAAAITACLRRFFNRPETALFALALGVSAYFFQAGGWNQNTRLALVRSLVERGTVCIDGYEQSTGDLALRDGHYYCDKAPGLSWLAVPVYAVVNALSRAGNANGAAVSRGAYIATVWAVALPSALAVAALYATACRLGLAPSWSAGLALAYALGTLALPYSTLFYGHQLAAALLFLGFALLLSARDADAGPGRAILIGLLLGYAVAVEYPSLLAVVPILIYAVFVLTPRRRLVWAAAGLLLPALALASYHAAAFGSPWSLPYAFSTGAPRHQGIVFGLRAPRLDVLYALTFSRFRGLFYSSPWLMLAAPGAVAALRNRRERPAALTCLSIAACYLLLNASLVDWDGGWAVGPRYLIPALPFLALLVAGVPLLGGSVRYARVALAAVAGPAVAAAVYSTSLMLMATAVQPEVPVWIRRPFDEYIVSRFRAGDLAVNTTAVHVLAASPRPEAWNLGQLGGLEGLVSLLPLAVGTLAGVAWLAGNVRRQRSAPAHGLERQATGGIRGCGRAGTR